MKDEQFPQSVQKNSSFFRLLGGPREKVNCVTSTFNSHRAGRNEGMIFFGCVIFILASQFRGLCLKYCISNFITTIYLSLSYVL